jgi:hypothetical protein
LVHGIESKVGFKALDYNGKGTSVEGEIINGKEEVVSLFKNNQSGMGSFILTNVDKNTTYFARIKSQSDRNISNIYPFPEVALLGNVIAIYTYGGKGIYGAFNPPAGIVRAVVPVFSASREFYAPKYKNIQPDDWYKPDLRALIYWEPKVIVDSLGKASTTFYNADTMGEMQVVVEAVSEEGEIGYQEMFYNVAKRE